MAKLEKASDDIIQFIESIIRSHGLDTFATFRFFELPKQKELIKVTKANATSEYFAKASDMCTVFVNPRVWDRLEDKQRTLLTENALNGIHYDDEKSKLIIEQPNLMISSDCYAKFGSQLVDAAEIVVHTVQQIKEEDKKAKEDKKAAKAEKGSKENGFGDEMGFGEDRGLRNQF